MEKLWGGRFQKTPDDLLYDFHSSIHFDYKMYKEDIEGSIAHVTMLAKVNIISEQEGDEIIKGLKDILYDIENGNIDFDKENEDIHMNIEVLLIERIGDVAKKMHTARSRNDQVTLDLKMYCIKEAKEIRGLLLKYLKIINQIAKDNIDTIMPGYTHLQRAQPISFAHYILAHAEMARRDIIRIDAYLKNNNTMPLGSGALAGTTLPIDREYTTDLLGFDMPCLNSIDGVSDRDYVIELIFICSLGMMHLSRLSEDIIIYSTSEFSFITLDDAYSTGSSMMPQKKNPDALELIRGKTGRMYGNLISLLTTMKGLPLAYNKDMQEDKEALFDSLDNYKKSLMIIAPILATMNINSKAMIKAAKGGYTNATDLADYLVKKNVTFRDAHSIVGKIVYYCVENDCDIDELSLDVLKKFSPSFDSSVYDAIDIKNCVDKRKSVGGPSPDRIKEHIKFIGEFISKYEDL